MGIDSEESQKIQEGAPFARTAPHCEHIVFTGSFCAADALTPAKRRRSKHTTDNKSQMKRRGEATRKRYLPV